MPLATERRLKQWYHGPLLTTSVTRCKNSWTSSSNLGLIRSSLHQWRASPASHAGNTLETYISWYLVLPENKSVLKSYSLKLLRISQICHSPPSPWPSVWSKPLFPHPIKHSRRQDAVPNLFALLCPTHQFNLQNTSLLMLSTAYHPSVALLLF